MVRRLPGSLLLVLLIVGLFYVYARPAAAGSTGVNSANVMVRVSPLTLLMQNKVEVKVGEYTCKYTDGIEPASMCLDLPVGEYEVSVMSDGYIASPPSYIVDITSNSNHPFYFRLYQNNHQVYMPNVQLKPQ